MPWNLNQILQAILNLFSGSSSCTVIAPGHFLNFQDSRFNDQSQVMLTSLLHRVIVVSFPVETALDILSELARHPQKVGALGNNVVQFVAQFLRSDKTDMWFLAIEVLPFVLAQTNTSWQDEATFCQIRILTQHST